MAFKPITAPAQNLASRPQSTVALQSSQQQSRELAATRAAKVLFGCYRTGEANDPEVYTTAVIATLTRYPEHIIRTVSDPRTGLPATSKFLPTVSEVREACEILAAREKRDAERVANEERVLAERRADEERAKRKPSVDDMKAKHGDNWGLSAPPLVKQDEEKARRMEELQKVNRRVFETECIAAGIPTSSPVSPSLIQAIRAKEKESAA